MIAHPKLREWLSIYITLWDIRLLNSSHQRLLANLSPGVVLSNTVKFKHFFLIMIKQFNPIDFKPSTKNGQ